MCGATRKEYTFGDPYWDNMKPTYIPDWESDGELGRYLHERKICVRCGEKGMLNIWHVCETCEEIENANNKDD